MAKKLEPTKNDSTLSELSAKHGQLASVEVGGVLYAFRMPDIDEWEDYQDRMNKPDARRGVCFRELAQRTLVHPSLEELQALFTRQPAISQPIATALCELAGLGVEVTVKKG